MYYLYGIEENIKNCYRAVHPFIDNSIAIETMSDLRVPYLDFLSKQQPECPINYDENPFVVDPEVEDKLSKAYSEGSLDDLKQSKLIGDSYNPDVKNNKLSFSIKALKIFFDKDPNLAAIFKLFIHTIFLKNYDKLNGSRGTHGGSSSGAIGVIWLTVNDEITELDLMEIFLHELTHHLIFVDELNRPQFNYKEIARSENFAYSAILNFNRPLDKVVHSIIVSTEIILARRSIFDPEGERTVHPKTDVMLGNSRAAYDSIMSLKNKDIVLRPRALELLDLCMDKLG